MPSLINALQKFAYMIFLPYVTGFLTFIGWGYYNTLSNGLPNLAPALIFAFCVVICAIILFFIRHTGHVIYLSREITGLWGLLWILLFLALFAISGYGFITSSMLVFEGPVIAREDLSHAETAISTLEDIAKNNLHSADYEELRRQTEQLRNQLKSEILNFSKGYCGIGSNARDIITTLSTLVPNIRVISGTDKDHSCDNRQRLQDMVAAYNKQIDDGLASSPLVAKDQVVQRQNVRDTVVPLLARDFDQLKALDAKLAGVTSFAGNLTLYHETIDALSAAASDYSQSYDLMSKYLALDKAGYPSRLQTPQLGQIASSVQIINTLFARWNRPTTLFYFLFALAFDAFAAFAASAVFKEYEKVENQRRNGGSVPRNDGTDVRYLWVPEPHPSHKKSR